VSAATASRCRFLPLPERFIVLATPSPKLPGSLEAEVEAIWCSEKARRGAKLFNGTLFSVEEVSSSTVSGRLIEYRRFLAQLRRPELFESLQVRPLAVTGLLQNAEGIFFGYRDSGMAQQANCWELIPAGGIDASTLTANSEVLPDEQILRELKEEVGLDRSLIVRQRLVAFCEEPEHRVFDLVWELETALDSSAVQAAHSRLEHPEHVDLVCAAWNDLETFLADGRRSFAAGNRELMSHLALHKGQM
jgi:8-oxo-dGTP pyrophosphatase MutT (NUDIX family)